MDWQTWVALAALALAVVALAVGVLTWRALKARPASFVAFDTPVSPELPSTGPPAIVYNPSKDRDWDHIRSIVDQVAGEAGLSEPLWLETTVADPGTGMAREAVRRGAGVVVAAGGDGTVRAVAEGLAGGTVPMAVMPLGTGNLLARNLDIPVLGLRDMVTVALTGRNRPMDVGWLRLERPPGPTDDDGERGDDDATPTTAAVPDDAPATDEALALDEPPAPPSAGAEDADDTAGPDEEREHLFLVIGGMGFDAAMVGGVDDELKARIGWIAYFVGGVRHLVGRKLRGRITLGGGEESDAFNARTVLIANCGRLPGGVVLLPDAQLDDGWLDIATIDTRGGLIGWADLLGRVVLQGLGIRNDRLPYGTGSLDFRRSRTVSVRTAQPEQVQVDGDLLGDAIAVHARLQHHGLVVRTP